MLAMLRVSVARIVHFILTSVRSVVGVLTVRDGVANDGHVTGVVEILRRSLREQKRLGVEVCRSIGTLLLRLLAYPQIELETLTVFTSKKSGLVDGFKRIHASKKVRVTGLF